MQTSNKAALEVMFQTLIGFVALFLLGHSYFGICSKIS